MKKYFFFLACLLFNLVNLNAQEYCDEIDVVQTTNITSNEVITAQETLIASNQVTGVADVIYQAGDYILFTGNAFVGNSATLLAKTESCIVSVKDVLIEGFELSLSNNPTSDVFGMSYSMTTSTELEITMIDLLGRQVKTIQQMEFITEGDHVLTTDVSDLPQGAYLLCFKTSTQKYFTERVVKF